VWVLKEGDIMRYIDLETGTELIEGIHDIGGLNVGALQENNPWLHPIPEGMQIEYDITGYPVGLMEEILPPKEPFLIEREARFAGIEFDDTSLDLELNKTNFNPVMCSCTDEDLWKISGFTEWIKVGNTVRLELANGSFLTLAPQNIEAFNAVWFPFIAGFHTT
jgi:hypothetical protein